jgi:hypothetical protein
MALINTVEDSGALPRDASTWVMFLISFQRSESLDVAVHWPHSTVSRSEEEHLV